mmetsp:Transcript_45017/g.97771  ORF Transcript_45017/g.97771 Transcript_45017/m.97771 type:complete len:181 (-) Transcript_45017:190-732(-)
MGNSVCIGEERGHSDNTQSSHYSCFDRTPRKEEGEGAPRAERAHAAAVTVALRNGEIEALASARERARAAASRSEVSSKGREEQEEEKVEEDVPGELGSREKAIYKLETALKGRSQQALADAVVAGEAVGLSSDKHGRAVLQRARQALRDLQARKLAAQARWAREAQMEAMASKEVEAQA